MFEYQRDFLVAYEDILKRGKTPILCGGTGLYVESILKGYRLQPVSENKELSASLASKTLPELTEMLKQYKSLHNTTDVDTAQRAIRAIEIEEYYKNNEKDAVLSFPKIDSVLIGIDIDREARCRKISARLKSRLEEGMVDEVRGILDSGVAPDNLIYYGLEYKYLTNYILGNLTYEQMYSELEIAIHQFAKRQMTWLRGMERRGFVIHWINAEKKMEDKISEIMGILKRF